MSLAHENTLLPIKHCIPVDKNTVFLAHYDVTEEESLFGIKPIGTPIATLRPGEGKFGGGIAIEEGTTNVSLMNGQDGVSPWHGDGGGSKTSIDPNITFRGRKVARYTPGANVNGYINGPTKIGTSSLSTAWTFSTYIKRVDGVPMDKPNGYLYVSGNPNYSGSGTIMEPAGDGWYRITLTRTGLVSGYPTLAGLYSLPLTEYLIADWQIEPKLFATSFVNGSRSDGNLMYPIKLEGDFTFSCWVKANVQSRSAYIFDTRTSSYGGHLLYSPSIAKVQWRSSSNGSTWDILTSTSDVYNGNWNFITIVKDGLTKKLYVNGKLEGTQTVTYFSNGGNLFIGSRYSYTEQLDGLLDEVRIDKVVRSDEEIKAWYESQAPFYPKGVHRVYG